MQPICTSLDLELCNEMVLLFASHPLNLTPTLNLKGAGWVVENDSPSQILGLNSREPNFYALGIIGGNFDSSSSISFKEAFRVFDLTGEGVLTKKYLKFSIMNCGDSSLPEVNL